MHEVELVADALGTRFQRSPLRAVDALGLLVRHRPLGRLRGAYLPPFAPEARAVVLLAPGAAHEANEYLLAVALGHHLLRHRALSAYLYTRAGALGIPEQERAEADRFARFYLRGSVARLAPGVLDADI
jgi:hypothetical protein